MNLLSFSFLAFCTVLVIIYYLVPMRFQWWILLAASLFFYAFSGIQNMLFVLITAASTYGATLLLQQEADTQKAWLKENKAAVSKEEKDAYKAKIQFRRRMILTITLILNFGLLCYFKYLKFAIASINNIIGAFGGQAIPDAWELIVPLGISFYTFQTMGYLLDIYWKKYLPEKNFLKVLLFVSFFPQMTQGPISDHQVLIKELFKDHTFTYHQFAWGCERMIWGFFKKMVIANILAEYVADVFANYASYSGITTLIGAFMYSIQIYADFSGYMDIICGLCEILGIKLSENFLRPYFSKSIAEYWRRWHITLGVWFKNYLYYPIAMSKWAQKLGRWARKNFGNAVGDNLPATVALIIVWLTTGLWHGATWAYIVWGGVNGLFIIFSMWMEPVYSSWKKRLHVDEHAFYWRAFQVIRTFTLVTFIKVLPEVGTLSDGLGLWAHIFTDHTIPSGYRELLPFLHSRIPLIIVIIGTILIFCTSMIQRKQPIRQWLEDHTNYIVRILIFAVIVIVIMEYGYPTVGKVGGFMYEQF